MAHSIFFCSKRLCVWSVLAAAVCGGACSHEASGTREPAERAAVEVTLSPVQTRPVERTVEVVGTLYGEEEATIATKVSGRVLRTLKDVGDRVGRGEPLAEIDPTDYELTVSQREAALMATLAELGLDSLPEGAFDPNRVPRVEQARVEAENAGARLARARTLFEQDPPRISEQDYADLATAAKVAASAVEVALMEAGALLADARTRSAELAQAQQALRDTVVRAPGEPQGEGGERPYAVARRLVSVGEYVSQGTPMYRVVDADPIKFRASVPERFIAVVERGQRVMVYVDAYREPFEGRVTRITPQINPANRTFEIEVEIENTEGRLRPGAFARGRVVTGVEEGVVFVPAEAVVSFAGVTKVFTVENGVAKEHRVVTGVRADGWVEIRSGLGAGASVAVEGVNRLADGVPVRTAAAVASEGAGAPSP